MTITHADDTKTTAPRSPARGALGDKVRRSVGIGRSMLHGEWIKFSSIRTNKVILAVTAALGTITSTGVGVFVTDEVLTVAEVYVYATVLTAALAAVSGALLFTSEAQHGTLVTTLAARPAPGTLIAAKTIIAAAFGAVLGAIGLTTGLVGALISGLAMGDTAGMAATSAWALLYTTLSAVIGLGVGLVVRHSSAAVSGLLVWWMVVENLILLFAPAEASRFLPFDAGYRLLEMESDFDTPEILAAALTRHQYALIFAGYAAAALAIGAVCARRRDHS